MPKSGAIAGWVAALTILGVALRLVFLLLAGDLEPKADESNYLYLALCWNRFGVYSDCALYLWPPGYPLFLALFLRAFGVGGIFAAKLCQVLLAGVVGSTIMLLAHRLFGRTAALLAGAVWCIYLPLIGFTHYLWPETLFLAVFLPGVYLFVTWWLRSARSAASGRRLLAAGLLIGLSLLIKEVGLWWCVLLAVLILWRDWRWSAVSALARAALFLLSVIVVVLPWTLRNYEVYGRVAPVGATLGQNVFFGLNAFYVNFDYTPAHNQELRRMPPWLIAPPGEPWARSSAPNVIDRLAENTRRGREYAVQHAGFTARTRLKKLADWATPLSFFTRHYALERYHGFLAEPAVRRVLIFAAVLLPMLVLGGAIPGFFWSLRVPGARALIGWSLAYFTLVTALINGMSRYRLVIEPLLIVLAAGFVAHLLRSRRRPGNGSFPIGVCGVALFALAFRWLVKFAEIGAVLYKVW